MRAKRCGRPCLVATSGGECGIRRRVERVLDQGLDALLAGVDGTVICHGDLPWVTSADIDWLVAAFSPDDERLICVTTHRGRRGQPVSWAKGFFAEIRQLRDGPSPEKSVSPFLMTCGKARWRHSAQFRAQGP